MSDIKTNIHYDSHEDRLTIERVQDVEPILEANKRAYANVERSHRYKEEAFNHVARIPLVIVEEWKKKYGVNVFNRHDEAKVRALLNMPEYRFLRTRPGKL